MLNKYYASHRRKICALENYPSDLYTSSSYPGLTSSVNFEDAQFKNFLTHFLRSADVVRHLSSSRALANNYEIDEEVRAERIRLASLSLIAKNLFKEMVVRQIQGYVNFYNTAKNIIYK